MVRCMRAPAPASAPTAARPREWLLVNGLGDSAWGTVTGTRVRSGHAALRIRDGEAAGRTVLLALDARAIVDDRTFELDARSTDTVLPRGEIESFTTEPLPEWRYRAGAARIGKRVLLLDDQHALVVVFTHLDGPAVRIAVAPLFVADDGDPPVAETVPGRVRIGAAGRTVTLWHDGAFLPARGREAPRDDAADEACESGVLVGFVEAALPEGGRLHLVIATDETLLRKLAEEGRLGTPPPRTLEGCVAAIETHERARLETERREAIAAAERTAHDAHVAHHPDDAAPAAPLLRDDDPWLPRFARAVAWSKQFGGDDDERLTDGVRELRLVRGLLTVRAIEPAREILLAYGQLVRDGLAPSALDPRGHPRYESAEPALWLVVDAELFARRTGEHEFVLRALYPALEQVIERYRAGTALGTRLDERGVLVTGEGAAASAPAGLNALWYTAQAALGQLARAVGRKQHGAFYLAWAREHQARALEQLWDGDAGVLRTQHAGEPAPTEAASVLAASLSPALLPAEHAQRLLAAIERELWTPGGLRDQAGSSRVLTEWMGPFLTAWVRAHGRAADAQQCARAWADRFERAIDAFATGHPPDAFERADGDTDGGPELRPRGAPLSVLAAAEMARFWVEDLDAEWRAIATDAMR